ncbi:pentapeptide repeat-containing protein [Streptomyces sp. NPDC088726]|uniref:pentapeptide repeat-containing protein n=1 Tax=Streptomyces sp. NPDC088726 TaxID=3365874 RepID=UPI0037F43305
MGTLASLSTLVVLVFTWLSLQQVEDEHALTREGQVTDRYNAAVGNIGDDSADVRLGGIYALQRIMDDSPRDQPSIVNVLSTYIRNHAKKPKQDTVASNTRLASDVQAALTTLGSRDRDHDGTARINLSGAHLTNANLTNADLTGANLSHADLTAANLNSASLTKAVLFGAVLSGAYLSDADLSHADLSHADLSDAYLPDAHLSHADLADADLTDTLLTDADLTSAFLRTTDLSGADLTDADLTDAYLFDVDLSGADLTGVDLTHVDLTGSKR